MTSCSDWEQEIAGESDSAGLAEHLHACGRCREFAQELEENRAALGEIAVPPAAFEAVRRRVLGEIEGKRRRATWWGWFAVASAACLAVLGILYALPRLQNPAAPAALAAKMGPPRIEWTLPRIRRVAARPRIHHKFGPDFAKATPAQKTEPLVVKMLTNDPNVIIIWLVDQKGDAL
jgi:hypothetical protein